MPKMVVETPIISRFPTIHLLNGATQHTIHGVLRLEFQSADKLTCDRVAQWTLAALEANGMVPPPTPIPDAVLVAAISDPEPVPAEAN